VCDNDSAGTLFDTVCRKFVLIEGSRIGLLCIIGLRKDHTAVTSHGCTIIFCEYIFPLFNRLNGCTQYDRLLSSLCCLSVCL